MIEQKTFNNGFEYLEITNTSARAKIALQGAHLFHYQRVDRQPLLWLSETSFLEAGKAIRGGVPICWPWFGKHTTDRSLPQHGFARNSVWKLLGVTETNADSSEVKLQLKSSVESIKIWPYRFELLLRITIAQTLTVALTTTNCDQHPFEISSALHSYFSVADIKDVVVEGLDNAPYFDALTQENKTQKGNVYISEEVDRVYQKVNNPLTLHDRKRTVQISAEGSASTVVWNPWQEKCARMNDMQEDGYKTMLCVETANAMDDERTIPPGEKHTLTTIIS